MSTIHKETVFYHATDRKKLLDIAQHGLRQGAYLTSDEKIAAYYADTVADEGGTPVVLTVVMGNLKKSKLLPDKPGIEEPITTLLAEDEEEIMALWEASEQTWKDSLTIVKSVRYDAIIPASTLKVLDDIGKHRRLATFLDCVLKVKLA